MERQKKVVDASVVMKWFVDEEGTDKALIFKREHNDGRVLLVVPDLLIMEILNVLKYKKKSLAELKKVGKDLIESQMQFERINDVLVEKALEISLEYDFTFYDSLYVALAQVNGVEFVTADENLTKARNVKLLKDV
jgi:predicted nucleic acid-binding protein